MTTSSELPAPGTAPQDAPPPAGRPDRDRSRWTGLILLLVTVAAIVLFLWWGMHASADPTGGCGGG